MGIPELSLQPDRIAQCQLCKRVVRRASLLEQTVQWMQPAAANYLPYSEYVSSHWEQIAGAGSLYGLASWGTHPDKRRSRYPDDLTAELIDPIGTWDGQVYIASMDGVDCSAWERVCFSVWTGADERDHPTYFRVKIGVTDNVRSTAWLSAFQRHMGATRHFVTKPISELSVLGLDLTNLCFTVDGFSDGKWWWEHAQLEKDALTPGHFVPTSGAAVIYPVDVVQTGVAALCPDCQLKEPLPTLSEPEDVPEDERADEEIASDVS
jgi:hypothetical protein